MIYCVSTLGKSSSGIQIPGNDVFLDCGEIQPMGLLVYLSEICLLNRKRPY